LKGDDKWSIAMIHRAALRQTFPGYCLTGLLVLSGLMIGSTFEARSEGPPVGLAERTEVRLRSVRMRIESVDRRLTDACADLGVDQLKVSLRGKELDSAVVRHLERDHRPAIHAVLIDTSSSMVGRLAYARDAAAQYIERLRPGLDRAMIATFDDSVILVQSHTDQQEVLREALGRVRLGGSTALIDGLYFILGELAGNRERGVVLLLTDGVDTTSFHDWDDVRARAAPEMETTMFVIGLGLPELQAGRTATRKILQKFAARTNGKFFYVPTAGRLEDVYLRILELLDSEAVLSLTDPDHDA